MPQTGLCAKCPGSIRTSSTLASWIRTQTTITPPSDIRSGQAFILDVYEALRRSPTWNETMLVVVYDEHGGFFDHQEPPAVSDDSGYATLGVPRPMLSLSDLGSSRLFVTRSLSTPP